MSGGSFYDYPGGMSSPICLPNTPTMYKQNSNEERSEIYTTEYESNNQVFPGNTDQYDAVCVACLLIGRSSTLMVPGTPSCPGTLQLEYSGYLMTSTKNNNAHATDAICVDGTPESMLGSDQNTDGALLYFVTADCNASFMPCDPYQHHVPMSCAVCSY